MRFGTFKIFSRSLIMAKSAKITSNSEVIGNSNVRTEDLLENLPEYGEPTKEEIEKYGTILGKSSILKVTKVYHKKGYFSKKSVHNGRTNY